MWLLLLPLLAQVPTDPALLDAEHARRQGAPALRAAAAGGDPRAQLGAARALGRLEDPANAGTLMPLLSSPSAPVRRAAAGALAQLRVSHDFSALLRTERDPTVRASMYEAAGRTRERSGAVEAMLATGLTDADPTARAGAARGLESLMRLDTTKTPVQPATVAALHAAFTANTGREIRQLLLLAMSAGGDRDSAALTAALRDTSALVRRLAVMGLRTWVDDPTPMVRYEALRVAGTCERAEQSLAGFGGHVTLAAIQVLGVQRCAGTSLRQRVTGDADWRIRAQALEAIAAGDAAAAAPLLAGMLNDPVWQVRAAVARVARIVKDTAALARLARDTAPNVAIEAITTSEDAVGVLRSEHAGLLLAAAERLKDAPDLRARLPRLVGTFNRLTADGTMTVRDARVAILTRIGEVADTSTNAVLRDALYDRDPAIATLAARILSARMGTTVSPGTTQLPIPPIPPANYIRALQGASARITMKGLGTMTVDLLTDEAPVTVGVFAQLAESGQYDGLTFHRIVPNFVIQGGSPGADEYDGRTREFMRDEVGFARNARGTIGISTRGRDTGDGQIYFNLVDNVRLDRDYTVMATMRRGLDVMDRIQAGDVIERIEIVRATSPACRPGARPSRRASPSCR